MPPGLVGLDLEMKNRQRRQKEQLRQWLLQQQSEQAQHYDQSRVEMDQKAQQLQRLEMERRKAEAIATKEYNLAIVSHPRNCYTDADMHVPLKLCHVINLFTNYLSVLFQRIELEKKQEEKLDDNARIASARMALLIERQQAKLSKQLRQHLDSTNVQLAKAHKQHYSVNYYTKYIHCGLN
uniref:RIB43A domain with coiled-coils 2 n=1 Tax=Echeneis naucrates TaxID=173247 RepID=A0A665UK15_ECHNA